VEAEKGRLLIDIAEELGIFVPRFCYHPGMKSVAVCRMCLVAIEGQRKLMPACATPVDDGMNVNTVDEQAIDAQRGMLEFLLINHPLDCPICDRAGECPLQDQTYQHGPGSSRYIEPKRTFEKALEISDLVVLDRERCVLCWRCVRFADEIAGDRFIQLVNRGPGTQVLAFNDEPFNSYFSGNTIQICPVGALTATTYRFVSRPWNLQAAPSVCAYCSVGCPVTNEVRGGKLVRCQALPNEQVNDFWMCDKGRFGFHYVSSDERLTSPLVRTEGEFRSTTWADAYKAIIPKLSGEVGVIAGGHLTTEDGFAIARLARKVLETPHLDSRIVDAGAPYELAVDATGIAGSSASLDDLVGASSILWVGPDPKESLPVLYLRLRRAVVDARARLVVVAPRAISLDEIAAQVIRSDAGGEVDALHRLQEDDLSEPFVACWAPGPGGRDESETFQAILDLTSALQGKLLVGPPHAGSQGLLDMGVHPRLDGGYRPAATEGKDSRAMLEAAAAGEIDTLLLFGADPITDFPDHDLARNALEKCKFVVTVELFPTESAVLSDVVLPSTAYSEREGTFTNLERRIQKLERVTEPPGVAREPWRLCADLAQALGQPWNWAGLSDIWDDIKKEIPTHADVDIAAVAAQAPLPTPIYETGFAPKEDLFRPGNGRAAIVAGPGAQYPKGYRSGAPFQTGQNWPLSWELRAFEAKQRPGVIPSVSKVAGDRLAESDAIDELADVSGRAGGPQDGADGQRNEPASAVSERSERGDEERPDTRTTPQEFVLYSGRMIYDDGAMVSKTAVLSSIQRPPFVELNPDDADALGVGAGDEVVVAANGNQVRLQVVIADIARGAVFVPFAQRGVQANKLMSGTDPRVTVTKP
ncbi:MAG: NADH-quinone oxidoreductase subunit NuoG, partial [Actinomycetota bacterium]